MVRQLLYAVYEEDNLGTQGAGVDTGLFYIFHR